MNFYLIGSGWLRACTFFLYLILQAALSRDNAFFCLILRQELITLFFCLLSLASLSLYEVSLQILLSLLRIHLHRRRIPFDSLDKTSDQIIYVSLATRQSL
jgi:hypothetical protein